MTMEIDTTVETAVLNPAARLNAQDFRSLFNTQDQGILTEGDILNNIESDPRIAFECLVQVLNRQTDDEKPLEGQPRSGGTIHKNLFGFSKKHVTRGSELAQNYLDGKPISMQDMEDAVNIAARYRKQCWMIALGGVPQNHIVVTVTRR